MSDERPAGDDLMANDPVRAELRRLLRIEERKGTVGLRRIVANMMAALKKKHDPKILLKRKLS